MPHSKLPELLYQGKDIPDILRLYIAELRKSPDFQSQAHASAISNYQSLITDKKISSSVRKEFDFLYSCLDKENPQLRFTMEGRRKSLISFENKILRLLRENRSLDSIKDIFAFRIVIFGALNPEELVQQCYSIMNQIIKFYVSNGYTLCEENPVTDTLNPQSPHYDEIIKEIVIPKETSIHPEYTYGIKDYIKNPKQKGYQSLHCAFRTQMGYYFEVQVRTLQMDIFASEGEANHEDYKKHKYSDRVIFEPSKVKIPGYCISKKGSIIDRVGLEQSLPIFTSQKTF